MSSRRACYPGDYRIIPNGVSVGKYAPAVGAAKVKGRVFFIGRAEKRKGLGVLLHAFARLRRRMPHASLVIAGATRGQALEASRLGYGPPLDLAGVEALGWVVDDEKVAQLGKAEVVCAPSLAAESFGIVLAEAMAAGVPVVASDLPGYRSVLRDGEAGRLVPPGDPALLAEALYEMLQDDEKRRRLAVAGLAAAESSRGAASPTRSSSPTRTPWRPATGPASTACRAGRGSAGPCSTTPSRVAEPGARSRFAAPGGVC